MNDRINFTPLPENLDDMLMDYVDDDTSAYVMTEDQATILPASRSLRLSEGTPLTSLPRVSCANRRANLAQKSVRTNAQTRAAENLNRNDDRLVSVTERGIAKGFD